MKSKLSIPLSLAFMISAMDAGAQTTPVHELGVEGLTGSGFVDTYAAHDFNDPEGERPYTTQAFEDDEYRVNLGMVGATMEREDWRGRLALQAGDSVKSNYAAEPELFFRYIQEGYLGYKLGEKTWLDAGVYLAHIGLESFNSRDNWNYTRSLVAEFSPYYETGVRLSHQFSDEWSGQLHALYGWQNISDDRDPALGMQVAWSPTSDTTVSYNNFVGDEDGLRVFQELLLKFNATDDLSLGVQLDLGHQEDHYSREGGWWNGFAVLTKYVVTPRISLGGRIERYVDPHGIIVSSLSEDSFNTVGASFNLDVQLVENVLWRNEYKAYFGGHDVFSDDDEFSSDDQLIVTSLTFSF